MSQTSTTIIETLQFGIRTLSDSDSPRLDSEILLLKVLNDGSDYKSDKLYTKTWLLTWPESELTLEQINQFQHYLDLRSQGMPIAYITGTKDFWSFTLDVTPETLIPRPETELLVECALEKIPTDDMQSILDLGTGSGAIALAIAVEREKSKLLATDISTQALHTAKENASKFKLDNVSFCQSHWFKGIPEQLFDIIVSNPPYIAENDPHLETNVRRYEPLTALISGDNGLADIKEIIVQSHHFLKHGGWLLFEHGYNQAEAVQTLFQTQNFYKIKTLKDLSGLPRVTIAQRAFNLE